MARDDARLRGRSIMPPFSLICLTCKKTYFMSGGDKPVCPECSSEEMVSQDASPTIFAKDVRKPRKKKTDNAEKEKTGKKA